MVDEKSLTFNLWLCASQDRGSRRFWKKETPVREQQIAEFKDHLESLLKEGREKLVQWSNAPDQLEFVTNIG